MLAPLVLVLSLVPIRPVLAVGGVLVADAAPGGAAVVAVIEPTVPECVAHGGCTGQWKHRSSACSVERVGEINYEIDKTETSDSRRLMGGRLSTH